MARSGNVSVEAYAGYKGEETPRTFMLEGLRHTVSEVLQRWYTETHSYFRVRVEDGGRYVLRYDLEAQVWELVMHLEGE